MLDFIYICAGIGIVVYLFAAYLDWLDGGDKRRRSAFFDPHWSFWKRRGWTAVDRAMKGLQ